MTAQRAHLCVAVVGAGLLIAAGCSHPPTYPTHRLVEATRQLLEDEGLHIIGTRLADRTLAVQLDEPNTLEQSGQQFGFGAGFDETLRKAFTVLHRVLLSTDAQIDFYVLLVSDPKYPGTYVTIVRYMDDIRRAYANMFDMSEILARTIFDLKYAGPGPLTLEHYVPIRLEQFLSWQLARRIQSKLMDALEPSGTALVGRCDGEFRDGQFVFSLNVGPSTMVPLDDLTIRKAFETSSDVIAHVLSDYRFSSFESVRLVHEPTGRDLVVPRARLAVPR